jgi:hypothetical protein
VINITIYIKPARSMPTTETPTPIPILSPVDSPEVELVDVEELGVWLGIEVVVGIADSVAVENIIETDVDLLLLKLKL